MIASSIATDFVIRMKPCKSGIAPRFRVEIRLMCKSSIVRPNKALHGPPVDARHASCMMYDFALARGAPCEKVSGGIAVQVGLINYCLLWCHISLWSEGTHWQFDAIIVPSESTMPSALVSTRIDRQSASRQCQESLQSKE